MTKWIFLVNTCMALIRMQLYFSFLGSVVFGYYKCPMGKVGSLHQYWVCFKTPWLQTVLLLHFWTCRWYASLLQYDFFFGERPITGTPLWKYKFCLSSFCDHSFD